MKEQFIQLTEGDQPVIIAVENIIMIQSLKNLTGATVTLNMLANNHRDSVPINIEVNENIDQIRSLIGLH